MNFNDRIESLTCLFVVYVFLFHCLRGVMLVCYLSLYCSTLRRTSETIWHFAAFVSRLLLFLSLLNTFTTSDTTSMSATLTSNRISVKSVKRKGAFVLFECECQFVFVYTELLVNNCWKVVSNDFVSCDNNLLVHTLIVPSKLWQTSTMAPRFFDSWARLSVVFLYERYLLETMKWNVGKL